MSKLNIVNRTGKKFSKEWIKKALLVPLDGFMLDKENKIITEAIKQALNQKQ